MTNNDDKFTFSIKEDDIDEIIDEKQNGNAFIALRKVSWGSNPYKLELRKWVIDNTGNEKPMKGISFFNEEEGTNTLINTLIKNNYGKTADILFNLKDRDDFNESLEKVKSGNIDDNDDTSDYFDPMEAIE